MRVLAALSGGVDSAVAAARAVDAGHEVVGVHMALTRNRAQTRSGSRGCCSIEDSADARWAAQILGIPFYVWDLSEEFEERVVADFLDEYRAGRTPNPCVRCNERVKFDALLERALALGFDAVATGHYARLSGGASSSRCAAPSMPPRTSPMSWPSPAARAWPGPSSPWGMPPPRRRCAPRPRPGACRWPPSRTPTTSASWPTATPAAS
mgnify:CR=1 FL=1